MKDILTTAGYCGLACKACSVYIASQAGGEELLKRATKANMTSDEMFCKGCRSEKTSPYCTKCDIKACIRKKKLEWCSECNEYPCKLIIDFKNSLPHRREIIESLNYVKNHSVDEWDNKMQEDFACPKCGTYNSVYADNCRKCKKTPVSRFAERHIEEIQNSNERNNVN